MPILINNFRISLLNTANKWRSGSLPPGRSDDFLQQSSIALFNEKVLAASTNNKIDDDLAPFLRSRNFPVTVPVGLNYGLLSRPSDYKYFWALRSFFTQNEDGSYTSCGCASSDNSACDANSQAIQITPTVDEIAISKEVVIEKIDGGKWASMLSHRSKFPTLDRPYCTQYDTGFKIAPRNINVVTWDYYRLPVKAVFGYTLLPSGYYQYDSTTSTNIEWGEQVFDELLDRTLKLFAVYLGNPKLYSFADNLKATRV